MAIRPSLTGKARRALRLEHFLRTAKKLAAPLGNPAWWYRVLTVTLALALLMMLAGTALAQGGKGGGDVGGALASLAEKFIDFLIVVAAILLAIGIATGFVTGMVETMVGRPGGLAMTWLRLGGIVVCFIGAIFTIYIANSIIGALSSYQGGTLNLPK